ncbi:MAG: hypothetical protein V4714_12150 [Bacteroidota bacterium]
MISSYLLKVILPFAYQYVRQQQALILEKGVALNEDQQIDAYLIGVKDIAKVRLLCVDTIPRPAIPTFLKEVTGFVNSLPKRAIGSTYGYGIYIQTDHWNQRRLVAHELTHTMQFERMGLQPFMKAYLTECMTFGYPHGPLEQEARRVAREICAD